MPLIPLCLLLLLALLAGCSCNDGLDFFNEPRIVHAVDGSAYLVKRAPMSCTFDVQRVPR